MRTIHKETIKVEEAVEKPVILTWRKGAKLVHIDYQVFGSISFWLEVDPEIDEWESRAFKVYPTGQPVHHDAEYVATSVQHDTDHLGFNISRAWHVYEHQI